MGHENECLEGGGVEKILGGERDTNIISTIILLFLDLSIKKGKQAN